jgi:hypothetical protein
MAKYSVENIAIANNKYVIMNIKLIEVLSTASLAGFSASGS